MKTIKDLGVYIIPALVVVFAIVFIVTSTFGPRSEGVSIESFMSEVYKLEPISLSEEVELKLASSLKDNESWCPDGADILDKLDPRNVTHELPEGESYKDTHRITVCIFSLEGVLHIKEYSFFNGSNHYIFWIESQQEHFMMADKNQGAQDLFPESRIDIVSDTVTCRVSVSRRGELQYFCVHSFGGIVRVFFCLNAVKYTYVFKA